MTISPASAPVHPRPSRFDPSAAAALLLLAAGVLLAVIATSRFGPGLRPDSANYLSAAETLAQGHGLRDVSGEPFVYWPPLFPALVAAAERLGVPGVTAGRWLSIASFAGTLLVAGGWLRAEIRSRSLRLLGMAALAFAPALQAPARFVLSEALFVLLVLLFAIHLQRFVDTCRRRDAVLWPLFLGLACLQRYAGAALLLVTALALLRRPARPVRDWAAAGGLVGAALLPLLLWLVRNHRVTGTLTGWRESSTVPLTRNLLLFMSGATGWFLPPASSGGGIGPTLAAAGLACGAAALLIAVLSSRARRAVVWERGRVLLLFLAVYSVWILASASAVAFDPISSRLLCPLLVPLCLCVLLALDGVSAAAGPRAWQRVLPALFVVPLLLFPAWRTLRETAGCLRDGPGGYARPEWARSPLLRYLHGDPPRDHPVYTNDPAALFLFLGVRGSLVPERSAPSILDCDAYERMQRDVRAAGGAYLVWFRGGYGGLYGRDEVTSEFGVEERAELPDGAVLLLHP